MDRIAEVIKKLGIYSGKLVDMRMEEYRGYHFETEGAAYETPQAQDGEEEETQEERSEDCLVHILTYADTEQSVIEEMQELVQKYRDLPGYVFHGRADVCNPQADHTDFLRYLLKSVYAYRKGGKRAYPDCGNVFEFRIYGCANGRRGECQYSDSISRSIWMSANLTMYTRFLNGCAVFMTEETSRRKRVRYGLPAYLAEMRKTGKITTEQQKHFMSNRELKVKFEIQNMFTSGNRATYGKLSTFCPILGEYDLINSIEKMLVTAAEAGRVTAQDPRHRFLRVLS